ncbi:carboxyltransferase domain-containing protein [Alicyclobacillus mali (ex Roth et al. 2021)]|uniref:carboxyltransferase domain-containing protein n=1 Tax=Alicyclobacillus mali (ex Roth et al. 2021) TaxID=1123961 RepID=UPI0023F3C03B|nr:carboxyltransferase domain-containing protein [Alicyclobacillus mali (ex Roth et al. 2021)]
MIEDKVRLEFMGDQALLLRLPEDVSIETGEALDRLLSLRAALLREFEGVRGIEDIIIGYRSVAVYARFEDVAPEDLLARARRAIQGSGGAPWLRRGRGPSSRCRWSTAVPSARTWARWPSAPDFRRRT